MLRTRKQSKENRITIHLNTWAGKQQRRAGDLLNSKTKGWSKDTQKVFLILVCLAFGAAIATMLFTAASPPPVIHISLPMRMDSLLVKDSLAILH